MQMMSDEIKEDEDVVKMINDETNEESTEVNIANNDPTTTTPVPPPTNHNDLFLKLLQEALVPLYAKVNNFAILTAELKKSNIDLIYKAEQASLRATEAIKTANEAQSAVNNAIKTSKNQQRYKKSLNPITYYLPSPYLPYLLSTYYQPSNPRLSKHK